jgi:hypothetical protein
MALPVHDVAVSVDLQPREVIVGSFAGPLVTVTNLGTQPEWIRLTNTVIKDGEPVWSAIRFVPVGVAGPNCPVCGQNQDLLMIATAPNWLGPCILQMGADIVVSPSTPLSILDGDPSDNFAQVVFVVVPPPL